MENFQNDEFILVKRKNKKVIKALQEINKHSYSSGESFVDKETIKRRIESAKDDIIQSDYYSSIQAILREGLDMLNNPGINEIVSYGLGHISEGMSARYQLALLLCLKDIFKVKLFTYDPLFTENEIDILQSYNIEIIDKNEEGKRQISDVVLLFLPHCPVQLTNNLLWANWNPLNLNKCLIISNSFSRCLEKMPKLSIVTNAEYLFKISPYVSELFIMNTFKYYDIFNDLSLHVFPNDKLTIINPDFWLSNKEPVYEDNESIELITKINELNI